MKSRYFKISIFLLFLFCLSECSIRLPKSGGNFEFSFWWEDYYEFFKKGRPALLIDKSSISQTEKLLIQKEYGSANRRNERYKLTEKSLSDLKNEIVIKPIEGELTTFQKQEFQSEEEFVAALTKQLGDNFTDDRKRVIVKYAEKEPQDYPRKNSNELLNLMQKAILHHIDGKGKIYKGDYQDKTCKLEEDKPLTNYFISNCYLEDAKSLIKTAQNTTHNESKKNENDPNLPYQALAYEKIMISIVGSLNYAVLKDYDSALVEIRQALAQLEKYHSEYYQNESFILNEATLKNLRIELDDELIDFLLETLQGKESIDLKLGGTEKSYSRTAYSQVIDEVVKNSRLKGDDFYRDEVKQFLLDQAQKVDYKIESFRLTSQILREIKSEIAEKIIARLEVLKNVRFMDKELFERTLERITGGELNHTNLEKITTSATESVYKNDAFVQYLKGVLYEWEGDCLGTQDSYRQALLAYRRASIDYITYHKFYLTPVPHQLKTDQKRMLEKLGSKVKPLCNVNEESPNGELVTISFNGLAPKKVIYSLPKVITSSKIPRFAQHPNQIAYAIVKMIPQEPLEKEKEKVSEKTMFLVQNLGEIASKNLDDRNNLNLILAGVKHAAEIIALDQGFQEIRRRVGNQNATLIRWIVQELDFEKVDLRSWSLLPDQIHMARQFVPAGNYKVNVYYYSKKNTIIGIREFPSVRITAGEKTFLSTHFAHQPNLEL